MTPLEGLNQQIAILESRFWTLDYATDEARALHEQIRELKLERRLLLRGIPDAPDGEPGE